MIRFGLSLPQGVGMELAGIKAHCEAVGRDYESIHRTASVLCSIGETDEQAQATVPAALQTRRGAGSVLIGSPETIRQHLAKWEEAGVQELILRFPDVLQLDTLRFFAREFLA